MNIRPGLGSRISAIFAGAALALCIGAGAQEEQLPPDLENLTADEILRIVRYSQALQNHDLSSRLRKEDKNVPVGISMRSETIYFKFRGPDQVIQLDLNDSGFSLKEQTVSGTQAVASRRYGEPIRGTDITYEDLSLRFLYWPKPVLLGEDRVKLKKCWKLRANNPSKVGPYAVVLVWVHQNSGGLLQVQGFDWDGNKIKEYRVNSGQKVGKTWIVKQMQVDTLDPGSGKRLGRTFLEVRKPKARKE